MSVRSALSPRRAARLTALGTLLLVGLLLLPAGTVLAAALPVPTLTATASGPVAFGGTISDTAHLSGGSGTLTGTISYQVFAPADTICFTPLTPAVTGATVSETVDAQDSFARTVSNGWGTANVGGAWSATGAEAPGAFAVDPANFGLQTTTSSGDTAVAGLPGTYANLDTKVRVKFDKTSVAGGENRARIIVRSNVASDIRISDYEFALSAPDGASPPLEAYIAKREGGPGTDVPLASNTSTGLAQDTTSYFWIRAQISGTTSVTAKIKVWKDGGAEPAGWSATYTDYTPAVALRGAGHINLSSYGNSNLPLTVHFADFQAVSLGDYPSGSFTPSTTGTYHWRASYSGDVNNQAVSTACGDAAQDSVVYSGATYVSLTPARLLDTRDGTGGLSGPFSSGLARTFQVTGHGGVPSGAIAVTGNLTVTEQTAYGYVALTPSPTNTPTTSTLNFPAGDVRANGVTVPLSGTGSLSATYITGGSGQTTHLLFDVTGYFVP